jgi:hypothetical protein
LGSSISARPAIVDAGECARQGIWRAAAELLEFHWHNDQHARMEEK